MKKTNTSLNENGSAGKKAVHPTRDEPRLAAPHRKAKQVVKLTRIPGDTTKMSVSFQFDSKTLGTDRTEQFYRGFAMMLRAVLTDEEAAEFLCEFEAERLRVFGGTKAGAV